MPAIVAVFIGGGLGSVVRYLLGKGVAHLSGDFPLGTLFSNVIATVILAMAMAWWLPAKNYPAWVSAFLLTGFCGGFSTFSTFSADTVRLYTNGHGLLAVTNVLVSIFACLLLAWLIIRKM